MRSVIAQLDGDTIINQSIKKRVSDILKTMTAKEFTPEQLQQKNLYEIRLK